MKKASVLLAALALAAFGLTACGDSNDTSSDTTAATTDETTSDTTAAGGAGGGSGGGGGGGATTLELSAAADGSFAFDTNSFEAPAGSVTINFTNPAALSHDVVVEDDSDTELGKADLVAQGDSSVTLDLAPGTYTYYCDVPGHQEGGMEGTITVK